MGGGPVEGGGGAVGGGSVGAGACWVVTTALVVGTADAGVVEEGLGLRVVDVAEGETGSTNGTRAPSTLPDRKSVV